MFVKFGSPCRVIEHGFARMRRIWTDFFLFLQPLYLFLTAEGAAIKVYQANHTNHKNHSSDIFSRSAGSSRITLNLFKIEDFI